MRAGNLPSKTQSVDSDVEGQEGEISIVQSIQLGFSRTPSGAAGPFGPNEISIFCPRTLQALPKLNAIFSGTSH